MSIISPPDHAHKPAPTYALERVPIRYTIGQFVALNSGKVKLCSSLAQKFAAYTMPACALETPYNNPLNVPFKEAMKGREPARTPTLKASAGVYDDKTILRTLRRAFCSVTTGEKSVVLAIANMNRTMIPHNMIDEVSKLCFDTIIQCSQQASEFLQVLFGITYPDGLENALHLAFVKHTLDTFDHPLIMPDSALEDGKSRTHRHRKATVCLMAHLFSFKFGKEPNIAKPRAFFTKADNARKRLLNPLFSGAETGDADELVNLSEALRILQSSGQDQLVKEYRPRIQALLKDDRFTQSSRLLLRDFV